MFGRKKEKIIIKSNLHDIHPLLKWPTMIQETRFYSYCIAWFLSIIFNAICLVLYAIVFEISKSYCSSTFCMIALGEILELTLIHSKKFSATHVNVMSMFFYWWFKLLYFKYNVFTTKLLLFVVESKLA